MAYEEARLGRREKAKEAAIGLLDFYRARERLLKSRRGIPKVDSSQHGHARPRGLDPAASCQHLEDCCNNSKRKRDRVSHESLGSANKKALTPVTTWTGKLWMTITKDPAACKENIELCSLNMQVPKDLVTDLPQDLHVTDVRPRRGIVTWGLRTCQTSITACNEAMLRRMAEFEQVALAQIGDCGVILVPYLKSGQITAVSFLVALA